MEMQTVKLGRRELYKRIFNALEALNESYTLKSKGIRHAVSEITQLRKTPAFHAAFNEALSDICG